LKGKAVSPRSRAIGRTIRDARNLRGLAQGQLARAAGLGASDLCRIELGTRTVTASSCGLLVGYLAVGLEHRSDVVRDLRECARAAGSRGESYWFATEADLEFQRRALRAELELAVSATLVCPMEIPWILHTDDYRNTLLGERAVSYPPSLTGTKLRHAELMLGEAALQRKLDPPWVVVDQLAALRSWLDEGFRIRVVPAAADPGVWPDCPFTVLTTKDGATFVHLDGRHSGIFLHHARDTAPYRDCVNRLIAAGIEETDAKTSIEDAIVEHHWAAKIP
jgi:transcriptional regulator with XRE-family HTH domain